MDLLLAHGYFLNEDSHEWRVMKPYPPLGILYLASHLRARGFAVEVFDATFASRAAFAARLARDRPPVVGFYCNWRTRAWIAEMIGECRRHGATAIVGGPGPQYYAEEFLEAGADVVVIGEGEITLEALLPRLADGRRDLAGVAGIVYRDDAGAIVRTPPRPLLADLDRQPFPARDAIDLGPYLETWRRHHAQTSVSLLAARGCPYSCAWCSHSVHGRTHRRRSPENVAAELAQLVERYDPDVLWYADDVFTIHHRWLFEYAAVLRRRGLRRPFECNARADRLNEEVVRTLAEMGCFRVWLGSESGSQRILDAMQRRLTVDEVQAATALLRRYGIESGLFVMLGYEGEEPADIAATIEHLKRSNPDTFMTTIAYPLKGTAYYAQVEDRLVAGEGGLAQFEPDRRIRGRHSRRYYRFATRWVVGSLALHRARQARERNPLRLARAAVSGGIGRLGMALTAAEAEA